MSKLVIESAHYITHGNLMVEGNSDIDSILTQAKEIGSSSVSQIKGVIAQLGQLSIVEVNPSKGYMLLKTPKLKKHTILIEGSNYRDIFDDDIQIESGNNSKIPIGSFHHAKKGHVIVMVSDNDPNNQAHLYEGMQTVEVPFRLLNTATKPMVHAIKKLVDMNYKDLEYEYTVEYFMSHPHDW